MSKALQQPEGPILWWLGQHCRGSGGRPRQSRGWAAPSALHLLLCICAWWARERNSPGGQDCVQGTGQLLGPLLRKTGNEGGVSTLAFLPTPSSGLTTCNAMPARSARAWPCSWAVWSSGRWPCGLSGEGACVSPPVLGSWPAQLSSRVGSKSGYVSREGTSGGRQRAGPGCLPSGPWDRSKCRVLSGWCPHLPLAATALASWMPAYSLWLPSK